MSTQTPSEAEVLRYFDTCSNWGRWGADDELGTLNQRVGAAADEVYWMIFGQPLRVK